MKRFFFSNIRWLPAIWLLGALGLSSCERAGMQVLHSAYGKPDSTWVRTIVPKPQQGEAVVVGHHYRKHVPIESVWGYRTRSGETYRFFQKAAYQVMQRSPLMIYQLDEWVGDSHWLSYHLSLTPDSDLYDLNKRACQLLFRNDECMVQLIREMSNRMLTDTDARGSYGVANAYEYCQHQAATSGQSQQSSDGK